MKVTIYCMNKGTASQYFALKDAEENQLLPFAPTWKTRTQAPATGPSNKVWSWFEQMPTRAGRAIARERAKRV